MVPICLYCLNCTQFGQLIIGKITKIVATRCQILSLSRLKCTKFDFDWCSVPDPAGELTALPDLIAGLKGPTSKGREEEGTGGKGREGKGREKKEKEGEGKERREGIWHTQLLGRFLH